jgi:hypothetical protein
VNRQLRYVDEVSELQEGWRDQLDRWGVTLIATPGVRLGSGRLLPLVAELELDPRWQLVVREPAGMLFVRADALPAGVRPLPKHLVWAQVLEETAGVDAPRARFARGVAHFKRHDFASAAVELAAYRAAHPEDREAAEIADLLQASARGDGAATRALEALYERGRSR